MTNKNNTTVLYCLILLLTICIGLLTACSEQLSITTADGTITEAIWDAQTSQLTVSGTATTTLSAVSITDADSGNIIGRANINNDGQWKTSIASAICTVGATFSDSITHRKAVKKSPTNCQQLTGNQVSYNRALRPAAIGDTAEPLFNAPNGIILSPQANTAINIGDTLNFSATATDPLGRSPIKYIWNFAGALPNRLAQNPGDITFTKAGTYKIILTTINNTGTPDPTPATRLIVVKGENATQSTPPVSNILTPASPTTIFVGDDLNFMGDGAGENIQSASELTYMWDFNSALTQPVAIPSLQSPGLLTFLEPGLFTIQLNVQDPTGTTSLLPAEILLNVLPANANLPPVGIINSPPLDVIINAGDTLFFTAIAADANSNILNYDWNFGSIAANNTLQQEPGLVTFADPGIFTILLTVTDAQGLAAPVKASRVITVVAVDPTAQPLALNNAILSPPTNIAITAGDTVAFIGEAATEDLNATAPLSYFWTFDGAAPDSFELNPGDITFNIPGEYEVKFRVINANGIEVGEKIERIIAVDVLLASINDFTEENVLINIGETIDFTGKIGGPALLPDQTMSFLWKFDDTTTILSTEQNPGPVTFDLSGKFEVEFEVIITDAAGFEVDTAEAEVEIYVIDPAAPPPIFPGDPGNNGQKIDGILSPSQDLFIAIGSSVIFEGQGIDIGATGTASYLWEFKLKTIPPNQSLPMPTMTEQLPGSIVFDQAGKHTVKYTARGIDATGIRIEWEGERHITVLDVLPVVPIPTPTVPTPTLAPVPTSTPIPTPPVPTSTPVPTPPVTSPADVTVVGTILAPTNDVTIQVGGSINFASEGRAPNGEPVSYLWNFAGAIPNTTIPNPGIVTFNRAGVYTVTLIVMNPARERDPNPPSVTITVTDATGTI